MSSINDKSSVGLRILSYVIIAVGAAWLGNVIFLFDKSIMHTTTFVGVIASFFLMIMLVLCVICLMLKDKKDIVDTTNMFTNGAFAIMGLFLTGFGGNKILTSHHAKDSTSIKLKPICSS